MQAMADIDTSKITALRPFTDEEALAWLRERGKLTIAGAQLARQWGWGERKAHRKLDDWKSDGLIKRSGKQITALGTPVLPKPDRSVLAKSDTKSDAQAVALIEAQILPPANPHAHPARPPAHRSWSAIGRAGVGVAIVVTGIWIACTSMRGNSWFGHSLTPDQTAGDIYSQLSVAAEVLACLIPTGIRFYRQDGERWTALRGWALLLVTLAGWCLAAGGIADTNL